MDEDVKKAEASAAAANAIKTECEDALAEAIPILEVSAVVSGWRHVKPQHVPGHTLLRQSASHDTVPSIVFALRLPFFIPCPLRPPSARWTPSSPALGALGQAQRPC